jgi:hypothetical protein
MYAMPKAQQLILYGRRVHDGADAFLPGQAEAKKYMKESYDVIYNLA